MIFGAILSELSNPFLIGVVVLSAVYGLVIGAIPGLTALMASALLVPFVIFMDPVPAVASIITASAMAIFAGDIPGALLRMPGTPASAAYTDEAFAMTRNGRGGLALGAGLLASAIGGLFSALVLSFSAPWLARIALSFSSVEYFWLATLGLSCATFVAGPSLLKGLLSLSLGLLLSTVGLDPIAGMPRFTFGSSDLVGGLGLIPILIGLFAISELLRTVASEPMSRPEQKPVGSIVALTLPRIWKHKIGLLRGGLIGTIVGALPGAGSDIAAWISYAFARRGSRYGRQESEDGSVERIMSASAANNASLGGAYIPATVFGIPGDAITAIVISVMFIKGINPGPTLFLMKPEVIYTIFALFFVANLIMIPLGLLCIHSFGVILKLPQALVSPVILMFCILGAFAVENTLFAVALVVIFGVLGYIMELNDIPLAPAILGLILGPLLEQTFMTTMMKSQGSLVLFFDRPIGGTLGVLTLAGWAIAILLQIRKTRRRTVAPSIHGSDRSDWVEIVH